MNAKFIIGAGLLSALAASFYYYGEYRAQEVRTEYNILNSQILNETRLQEKELQEAANDLAYKLDKQTREGDKRISELQARLRGLYGDLPDISLDIVIELFVEAASDSGLPPSLDSAIIIGEKDTASFTLYAIGEYNACALQLNALIDVIH